MQINGQTKTCGLIGNPVEHTLSPVIHNNLASLTGINMVYVPFKVEADLVEDVIVGAHAMGIWGLNVTVPHKERVIPCLKEIDSLAHKIGAVNTLVPCEGGYKGYNTDMPGLYRAMVSDGISVDGEQVIILGAGGVARAVAVMLAEKVEKIYILNRTVEKAEAIAAEVNGYAGREVAVRMSLADYNKLPEGQYLTIQATNIGMHPKVEDAVITDKAFYEKVHTGYDMIYNPGETKFMELVKEQGGIAFNGLKMLLYQGIIAYELWNRISISEDAAKEIYEKLKEKL